MQQLIKLSFIAILLTSVTAVFGQATTPVKKSTTTKQVKVAKPAVQMTFENEKVALGPMKKGDKKKFDYVFTNTGTDDIEIDIVSGCDCTKLDWTRGKIKPGQKGTVNVIFDSTEKEITEKSVDIDIYLKNLDKKTKSQIAKYLTYTFELKK
jgi:hypothetical protein